jgi:hypothetical protein
MGYPLNSYTFLTSILSKDEKKKLGLAAVDNGLNSETANSLLNSFNLFVFVIHDPVKHSRFNDYLKAKFERLDHSTGQHLLFFTLVKPSNQWNNRASQRPYFEALNCLDNPAVSANNRITADTMSMIFQIPYEHLPAIVVTNNLKKNHYIWFKTSENVLEEQLNELGYLSTECPQVKNDWNLAQSLFSKFEENFNVCNSSGSGLLTNSIARSLSDLLSFVLAGSSDRGEQYHHAISQARVSLFNLQTELKQLKANSNKSDSIYHLAESEYFNDLNIKIGKFIFLLNSSPRPTKIDSYISLNEEYFDEESKQLLMTAQSVISFFNNPHNLFDDESGKKIKYDYTPAGICFTKAFENEINLSVVHWIRKKLGVKLPDFYNEVDTEIGDDIGLIPDNIILKNPRKIFFNKKNKKSGKWLPPGMNESQICFHSLIKAEESSNPLQVDESNIQNILSQWEKLGVLRNSLAHAQLIRVDTINEIIHTIEALNNLNFFNKTYMLKKSLRKK